MTAVILGGGISGLASAYYLVRYPNPFKRIIVLESSNRLGGWIQTTRLDNGALFEHGPRSIRPVGKSGLNSLSLATELGLSNEIIAVPSSHPAAKNRYIYVNKKLNILPGVTGLKSFFVKQPLLSQPIFKILMKEVRTPKGEAEDESIYSFASRRFGTEVADYIMNPMLRGIFAGDIKKLSMKSCLPPIYEMEQEHGSVVKAGLKLRKPKPDGNGETYALNDIQRAKQEKWSTWSFRNGLSQLTDRLGEVVTKYGGVEIRKSTPCTKLEIDNNVIKVETDTESITADHLISSVLSQDLSRLLANQHKELTDCLNMIPAVTCIVVNVEYKNYLPTFEGFGHLLPSSEDPCVLGVIYDSSTFKPHDTDRYVSARYTVMLGGEWYDDLVTRLGDLKESTIQEFACKVLREQLDIQEEPSAVIVSIQKNCIPQYYVGHSKIVNSIDSYIENHNLPLSLVGSSYKGVSLNDCIHNAKIEMARIRDKLLPDVQTVDQNSDSAEKRADTG